LAQLYSGFPYLKWEEVSYIFRLPDNGRRSPMYIFTDASVLQVAYQHYQEMRPLHINGRFNLRSANTFYSCAQREYFHKMKINDF
jgi:hypothetical protein